MNADEKAIVDYLKGWPNTYISGKELARKVGGKERYEEDRHWAVPILAVMVTKNWLERDSMGYFRLKREEKKKNAFKRHVSPQILRILKSSGKSFEGMSIDIAPDESEAPAIQRVKPAAPGSGAGSRGSERSS